MAPPVSDRFIITITDSANTAPTVNAGTDQEITEGDTVTLAGTATDADQEDDLTYSWSHDSTLFISLDDSTLTPSFTVPNVSEDTAVEFTLTVSDGIITVSDSIIITITDSANTAPTVNAGTDQEITEGSTVTLAGTATDADQEDDLTYSWSHDSTLFISLDDSTLTPSFTVPNVSEDTAVEFTLTVSDGIITVSDSIIITITDSANTAPTVNAGTDQEITEGSTVTLAGTATDADQEDDLTYSWSHDSTLFISLDDSTLTPSFTVPNVSEDTAVEFTLTVSDGIITVSDSIIITITDSANTAPTVNAGTDQEITEGSTVTLAGTATDADQEDDLTYSWSHDSTLFISLDDSTLTPSFTVPNVSEDTAVEFTLTVSDGIITVSDSIIITITDSANTAPTVNAGTDQEITEGSTVTLAGTATDADQEDDLTYSWSHDSTLFISLDDSTLTPSFTVPNVSEDTAVEFTLTVSDGIITVSDSIIITITDSANTAPTVNAGTDQEITEGDTVTLAGTATDADQEDDLTYSWSHDSTLFISLDDSTLTPSFTVPNVSEDTAVEFTLTVSDGIITVSDSIIITITDSANTAPTVNAGTDQEITEGDTVTLAGTATDADQEDDLTYSWSHDSTLFISLDDSTLTPSFTVPNVSEDTAVEFTLTVSDGIITVSDSIIITITDSANTAPTADAGTDQEITEGDTVTLAGTATDADQEDDLTYSWSHDSTLFISLDDSTLTPSFTVPNVSEDTAVEFTLTVSDGIITVSDSIIITITDSANTAPTVNAGTDQEITEGDTVTLAGTATDADQEDDLTYSWSHDSTLFISLDDSTLTPSFTVPNVSEDTAVEFTLTVSDGIITVSDSIIITITDSANTAPTADAGTDQEITEGDTVTLAGTATDADQEDDLTYSWSHDSTLFISLDDSTLTPSFTVPNVSEDTAVEFTLTVSDGIITVSDSIIITITDSANTAPTVNAGTDQEITEGDTVTLAGTATDADQEDDLTYSWSHDSTLFISLDDSTLTPSFTVPNVSEDTAVEFTLTVSDGIITVSDSIIITITDSANTAPTVNAGTDQEITEGDTVTLAGTATDADQEDDLTYSWSHDSTLFISLDDSTLTPSFTVPNVSEDTAVEFTLTVSDGIITVSDSIIITITDSANTAPTVNAGTDQEITEGDTVTLAGTATDADQEDDLTYSWSHDSTLFISLDDSTLTPSFTVPNVSEDTAVEFTLTVSDGIITVSDSIIITITDSANTAPTVNAGTDQEITEGDTVTLAGTATDADQEDDLTYSWSHDSTLFISLDDSTLTPSFTVPNVSEDTAVEFTLTVSDGIITVSDSIIITITDSANTAPTVNAGTDQEITEGDTVTLAGTATDADQEDDLTYSWSHDSTLFISLDDSTLTPSFTVPNVSEDTAVEFTLTVSDGIITVSDSIIITITDSANTAPTVNAGTDQEITEGSTVTLAGTATDADQEDDLTYSWSHDSTLFISLDDSTLTPSFTVPNVSEDTAVEFTLTVSDGIITVSDSIIITITDSANTAPTVNAGTDQEITEGSTVTLAGTATDADQEDDLTYSWSHDSTLFISLDDSTLTPSFTVPNVSEDTAVEFTLTVSDGIITVSDSIIITITDSANTAPTVNAGTDQEITEGDTVTLAGTATDADQEDDLTYSWSHDSTLFISLDDSTLTPSFTVPNVSEDTAVEFTLTVSDGIITVSDSIIITITDSANTAPTVNAGTDQEITEGDTVTLAGTATDADQEDDLTYSWSHDSTLFISLDDSTLTPSFTVPNVSEDTAVEFTLTVSDGIITVSDSIIITITDSANTAPTVNAGTDQEITEGDTVTLAGTATDADQEDDLTYSWSHDSTLFISLDDSTLTPSFTVPNVSEDTAVEFTLTVSDGIITVSDSIIITITDSANTAPTVNAGTDQEITEGDTVTLAGTATDADQEDDLTYSWSHDSTLFISLDDSTLTPSFTVPNVSEDTAVEFTLTVSDGIITVSDSIIITITDSANTAPTVNAGTDQEITEGDTVTLAGTATDADQEDDLTYSWSHDSTLFISLDDSTLTPSFTVPNVSEDTAVEFTLTVSDGIITVSDSIIITITDSANTAPTVNAGTDQEITEGDTPLQALPRTQTRRTT